jgi:hypothetical protein
MTTVDTFVVHDRIRISVELIRQMADEPDFLSVVVEVKEIRLEDDGTKTLVLARLEDARPC